MSNRHSVHSVNILFLIVLLLQLMNFFAADMPQYPRLIANEALFVLLPSLLYLRWEGLPFRKAVRLRSPGWKTGLASLLIGAGLYPVSIALASVFQMLLGYTMTGSETLLPKTPFEGVLAIIAYAVMAPVCEEIFARGIIQRTYHDRFGSGKAILLSGGLFIMFHLSLLQGLSIIPLSLALGYVYWRTESLAASILTHFGANAMAALVVTSNVFWQTAPSVLVSPMSMLIGILLAAAGYTYLKKNTNPKQKPKQVRPSLARHAWPLIVAGLIYLGLIGLEVSVGRSPETFLDPVTVDASRLIAAGEWDYALYNRADDAVAEITCRLEPQEDTILLRWGSVHQAYDVEVDRGRFVGSDAKITEEVTYRRTDGQLLQGVHLGEFEWGKSKTEWAIDSERLLVKYAHAGETEQTVQNFELVLEEAEGKLILEGTSWPWILAALPFSPNYAGSAYYVRPYAWRQETNDHGPMLEQVQVRVSGPETLETSAGPLQAWKVTVGQETAWYSVDAPNVLLQHDNGFETKLLVTLLNPVN
ncbi:MAG: CPBP family intramembrane metalloprotease [Firmicutes bacterium]|nr:CPBP family intramembrane metalloprotease [Bacillota bacterium]